MNQNQNIEYKEDMTQEYIKKGIVGSFDMGQSKESKIENMHNADIDNMMAIIRNPVRMTMFCQLASEQGFKVLRVFTQKQK